MTLELGAPAQAQGGALVGRKDQVRFGPFLGFFCRAARHDAPPGMLTADSRDWAYSPSRGVWKRRNGSAIKGDTVSGTTEVTGLLPAKWSAKTRQLFQLVSDSLSDGQPTVAGLWTSETGYWGQISFYNTNTSAWQVIGARFSSGPDYPITGATNVNRFRMVPLYSTDNALLYTRCADEKQRRMLFPGSRRLLQLGNWLYAPNEHGTPCRWGLRFADSGQQTYAEEVFPSGHIPPLWVPDFTKPGATAAGGEPWGGKSSFYATACFKHEDGSYSRPFVIVGPANVALGGTYPKQNGAGFVLQLEDPAAGGYPNKFAYITWNHIPPPPPGYTHTALMRTVPVDTPTLPDITTLGIIAEVPAGVTSFVDYGFAPFDPIGDALATVKIRFADHCWPRRARYYFTFDGHIAACGKLRANPAALIIAPYLISGTYYTQTAGSSDLTTERTVSVCEDQVNASYAVKRLVLGLAGTRPTGGGISLGASGSGSALSSIVNTIAATASGDTADTKGAWRAQIVPGVADSVTSDNIEYTQVRANFSTDSTSPTITVQARGDAAPGNTTYIVVGMKISGSGIGAGSYVGSKNATTVSMVDSSGAAKNATLTQPAPGVPLFFGWDFGDTNPGDIRCFSNAYPAVLYFHSTYMATLPTQERAVDFTGADPGHPKYCAMSWYLPRNTRDVPRDYGQCMGGGEVQNGAIVFYASGRAVLTNTRGGKTNADDDWLLQPVYGSRGTISPEIIQGNGWLGHWTTEGFEVADATSSVIITSDLFDPAEQWDYTNVAEKGELSYEVRQSGAAAIAGTDDCHLHAHLDGSRIIVSYRARDTDTYPKRCMVYDFSPSAGLVGVANVLDKDGGLFPWTPAWTLRVGCMTTVYRSDGRHLYGAIDSNAGGTGNGRVDEFDVAGQHTDTGAVAIAPLGYMQAAMAGEEETLTANKIAVRYKKAASGLTIELSGDEARVRSDVIATLGSTGSNPYGRYRGGVPSAGRSNRKVLELVLKDDGSGSAVGEFHSVTLDFERRQDMGRS